MLKYGVVRELSAEKTLITRPEDGFVFLGYRVVRAASLRSGVAVGKLWIPKGKLKALRREIKKRTGRSSLGLPLKQLIRNLNPLDHRLADLLSVRHLRLLGVQ